MTKSSKFLRVLSGESLSPPPIWFMRQAGRYLPEYRAVRAEAGSFLDLCYSPSFATEVTLQPIRRYDLDAAILFADILLIPHSLGLNVWFAEGEGPRIEPVFSPDMLTSLNLDRIDKVLSPIYETVSSVRAKLSPDKALIGFAGAPWTVATYMIAGRGSKDPTALRRVAYEHPEAFDRMIRILVDATSHYLIEQVKAGADAIQIFDSWAGGLPEQFFEKYCVSPTVEIAERVKSATGCPVIAFPRAAGALYERVASQPMIDGVSIDTGMPAAYAAECLSPHGAVQGGLDPLLLLKGGEPMFESAEHLLQSFDGKPYIFNIGHGLVPDIPPENVGALVDFIRAR